jgi:hypothetical protein
MYSKPEVRVISDQEVSSRPVEVTSSEAANLLAKYGYSTHQSHNTDNNSANSGLTVQELYDQYDREIEKQKQMEFERRNRPKSVTFDSRNINYSSTDYRSLDDDFGIQVQVVSDMPINNNRRY